MNKQAGLLADRVAIITGGAEGIGSAIARSFAAAGASIVIPDINEDGAEEIAAQIRAAGHRALALRCDVRRQDDVDRMVAVTLETFGQVHVLVNNVGGTTVKPFMDMAEEEWLDMLDLNLIQVFRCTRAVARVMIDRGIEGSIINMTTIEGYRAAPGFAPYAAAKAGLVNFTRTMALELSPWGIRVNSIAPDYTPTPGISKVHQQLRTQTHQAPRSERESRLAYVPLGRPGTPEDFGGAALFLASDLSKYVTGEDIHLDGGTFAASGWTRSASGHWSLGSAPLAYSGRPAPQ